MKERLRPITACVLLMLASTVVQAHGTKSHAPNNAPVVKEQTAWGIAGEPQQATRTLEVIMTDDMRFTPGKVTVREGETVRIVAKNAGKIMHELVIGDETSLREHAEMMMKFPNMAHDEPYMAHVPPGETVEIVWTFNRAGEFEFACLLPGHFQAGMVADVTVERAEQASLVQPDGSSRRHH